MNIDSIKNMYDDFFCSNFLFNDNKVEETVKEETNFDIDSVLLDKESKLLLKRNN